MRKTKAGFTIIEVMLVVALTGLLLVGVLGTTFNSINSQRYNDTVRSFVEYLHAVYNEVANPESLGKGNSKTDAILGKLLVFGVDYGNTEINNRIYSATVIGNANIPESTGGSIVDELKMVQARLVCGTVDPATPTSVEYYTPLWQGQITQAGSPNSAFTGGILIVRSPTSGTIHTLYNSGAKYNLKNYCQPGRTNASEDFRQNIQDKKYQIAYGDYNTGIGVCVKSSDASRFREVRISPDGHNSSAVVVVNTDVIDTINDDGTYVTVGNRCL